MSEFSPVTHNTVLSMPTETYGTLLEDDFNTLIEQAGFEAEIAAPISEGVKEEIVYFVTTVLKLDDLETEIAVHTADAGIPRKTRFGRLNTDPERLGSKLTLLKMSHGRTVCKVDLAKVGERTAPFKLIKPDLAERMFENYFAKGEPAMILEEILEDDEITLASGLTKKIVEKLLEN